MSSEYALVHYISADLCMVRNIVENFKTNEIKIQKQSAGGMAVLKHEKGFINHLVTKTFYWEKPNLEKLWCAVEKMKNHAISNAVKKLAMPEIGCGIDKLKWTDVKNIICFSFRDVEIDIALCYYRANSRKYWRHTLKCLYSQE
ncbi:hypothetical protein JTB14_013867 [Gonioctena quinquepunctata]|nr:hypothetical protein JTB14_013867 [Gonioctena quinquepunctata]